MIMKKNTSEKQETEIYVDRCHGLHPNHADHTQEIYLEFKSWSGKVYTLIFTPEDWLDTFTPTMYKHVKKQYIKYLEQKE
jgi:hypothetical protein